MALLFHERVTGVEPALNAWKALVLPLNYTHIVLGNVMASESPYRAVTIQMR